MIVYLDNCCFNRPFDDQSQLRIKLETEAKIKIQDDILNENIRLVWSYILEYENNKNPFEERKQSIEGWKNNSYIDINENEHIVKNAEELKQLGFKTKDSLHIACAVFAKSDYFLTTDDKILSKSGMVNEVKIIDPIGFIKEVYK
ncbi:PIN domain-containing protein [Desulfonema limicola]|uniref:PIN domain-containing protein n=1 Tax=Desulfonema limicola TaxID=45656 RepID=A0A975GHE2_9BACT|nr:hypothetical protein [Desulfonema limicola]QTA81267.1 PIN domain-containing protein [Desulfonema limicola]